MNLAVQKRIAASIADCSPKRIKFDTTKLAEIKEAITRSDLERLMNSGAIGIIPKKGVSRGRAKKADIQRSKGRRKGPGSRKGKPTARLGRKRRWISKVRLQRKKLQELRLKEKIARKDFRLLYRKSKGGVFRSLHHMMLYIEENKMRK